MKGRLKLGKASVGGDDRAALRASKAASLAGPQSGRGEVPDAGDSRGCQVPSGSFWNRVLFVRRVRGAATLA